MARSCRPTRRLKAIQAEPTHVDALAGWAKIANLPNLAQDGAQSVAAFAISFSIAPKSSRIARLGKPACRMRAKAAKPRAKISGNEWPSSRVRQPWFR